MENFFLLTFLLDNIKNVTVKIIRIIIMIIKTQKIIIPLCCHYNKELSFTDIPKNQNLLLIYSLFIAHNVYGVIYLCLLYLAWILVILLFLNLLLLFLL